MKFCLGAQDDTAEAPKLQEVEALASVPVLNLGSAPFWLHNVGQIV